MGSDESADRMSAPDFPGPPPVHRSADKNPPAAIRLTHKQRALIVEAMARLSDAFRGEIEVATDKQSRKVLHTRRRQCRQIAEIVAGRKASFFDREWARRLRPRGG